MFPVGKTVLNSRWEVAEWLEGGPFDGRYRCRGLLEHAGQTAIAYVGLKRRAWDPPAPEVPRLAAEGVAEFLGDDAVDYDGRTLHVLLEREPSGDPVSSIAGTLDARRLAGVAASLYAICTRVHTGGAALLGIRPETVYVTATEAGVSVAVLPRWPSFRAITADSHLGGASIFEVPYFPPEVMLDRPRSASAVDVFCAAATIWFLSTGTHPFAGDAWFEIERSTLDGRLRDADVRSPERELLLAGLAMDPAKRPAAAELSARWSRLV
jgi:hypothetical protein